MPDSCCVVDCCNRRDKGNASLPFYRIPKGKTLVEKRRRELWLKALAREDWKKWSDQQISLARVCGAHFVSGKRSDNPENIDQIPTIFTHAKKKPMKEVVASAQRKQRYKILNQKCFSSMLKQRCREDTMDECNVQRSSEEALDDTIAAESICSNEYHSGLEEKNLELTNKLRDYEEQLRIYKEECRIKTEECQHLQEKINANEKRFGFSTLKNNSSLLNFYTGISLTSLFLWILNRIKDNVKIYLQRLSLENHLLIVLIKLVFLIKMLYNKYI